MFGQSQATATLQSEGPIAISVDWIADILTGSAGTAVAVLAIAGIGVAMLQGRLAAKDGMRSVLGCFVLFGAPVIADALSELTGTASAESAEIYSAPPPLPPMSIPTPPQLDRDPYAGASVPM